MAFTGTSRLPEHGEQQTKVVTPMIASARRQPVVDGRLGVDELRRVALDPELEGRLDVPDPVDEVLTLG